MFYNTYHRTSLAVDAMIAEKDAQAKSLPPRETPGEIFQLRLDIEGLLMISEALWGVLKEKHGYTDEELLRRVADIDLRDGKSDGRVAPEPPSPCPHCGYTIRKRRPTCLYCGKPVGSTPFAR